MINCCSTTSGYTKDCDNKLQGGLEYIEITPNQLGMGEAVFVSKVYKVRYKFIWNRPIVEYFDDMVEIQKRFGIYFKKTA